MIATPARNRFDPRRIERGLDEAEAVFRRIWRRLINRYVTSINIDQGRLAIPVLVEAELRQSVRELARAMRDFGRREMQREIGRAQFAAAMPEDPRLADELIDRLLLDIPVEADRIVKSVMVDGSGDLREAMQALSREFPTWTKPKLERIGRTVASFYFNRGRAEVMREAGLTLFTISAILDSRICPVCYGLDGLVFDLDDGLDVWPPEHFSCRCMAVPHFDQDKPVIRSYRELQEAANKRLRDGGFTLGKKAVTEWPGIQDGWGVAPTTRRGQLPARLQEIERIVVEQRDSLMLAGIVDVVLAAAVTIGAAEALRRFRRVQRAVKDNPDLFGGSASALIESIRRQYNISRVQAVMVAADYVERRLKMMGRL